MKRFLKTSSFLLLGILFPLLTISFEPLPGQIVGIYGRGEGYNDDLPLCLENSNDGGFIICGDTPGSSNRDYYDILLIRIDSEGKLLWGKQFGGAQTEEAYGITRTNDGAYIVAGYSYSIHCDGGICTSSSWVFKVDDVGNVLWQKSYGNNEALIKIAQSQDGNYIAAGGVFDESNVLHGLIIKLDPAGNVIWKKEVKTIGLSFENFKLLDDGGFIAWGYSWLFRFDGDGNLIWAKKFDEADGEVYDVSETVSGGYLLAMHRTDMAVYGYPTIVNLAKDGTIGWSKRIPVVYDSHESNVSITQLFPKGDGTVTGFSYFYNCASANGKYYSGQGIISFNNDGIMGNEVLFNYGPYFMRTHSLNSALLAADGNLAYCGLLFEKSYYYGFIKTGSGNKIDGDCSANIEIPIIWENFPVAAPISESYDVVNLNSSCIDTTPLNLVTDPSVRGINTFCPVIYQVNKLQNPFRLEILGDNFYPPTNGGLYVPAILINDEAVPKFSYKSSQQIIAKKGDSLKSMLPKGVTVCIQVRAVNAANQKHPLYKSDCFTYTR